MSKHHVTVENGRVTKLVCPEAEECHVYPKCDCEQWADDHAEEYGEGHEKARHDDCWMKGWFMADGACYNGTDQNDMADSGLPEGMTRSGYIDYEFEECPLWHFTDDADVTL